MNFQCEHTTLTELAKKRREKLQVEKDAFDKWINENPSEKEKKDYVVFHNGNLVGRGQSYAEAISNSTSPGFSYCTRVDGYVVPIVRMNPNQNVTLPITKESLFPPIDTSLIPAEHRDTFVASIERGRDNQVKELTKLYNEQYGELITKESLFPPINTSRIPMEHRDAYVTEVERAREKRVRKLTKLYNEQHSNDEDG